MSRRQPISHDLKIIGAERARPEKIQGPLPNYTIQLLRKSTAVVFVHIIMPLLSVDPPFIVLYSDVCCLYQTTIALIHSTKISCCMGKEIFQFLKAKRIGDILVCGTDIFTHETTHTEEEKKKNVVCVGTDNFDSNKQNGRCTHSMHTHFVTALGERYLKLGNGS